MLLLVLISENLNSFFPNHAVLFHICIKYAYDKKELEFNKTKTFEAS